MIYGADSSDELVFRSELEAITAQNENIRCHFTVTGPVSAEWGGHTGRIDSTMLASLVPSRESLFFICGPAGMTESVTDLLLRMGVAEGQVRVERW